MRWWLFCCSVKVLPEDGNGSLTPAYVQATEGKNGYVMNLRNDDRCCPFRKKMFSSNENWTDISSPPDWSSNTRLNFGALAEARLFWVELPRIQPRSQNLSLYTSLRWSRREGYVTCMANAVNDPRQCALEAGESVSICSEFDLV